MATISDLGRSGAEFQKRLWSLTPALNALQATLVHNMEPFRAMQEQARTTQAAFDALSAPFAAAQKNMEVVASVIGQRIQFAANLSETFSSQLRSALQDMQLPRATVAPDLTAQMTHSLRAFGAVSQSWTRYKERLHVDPNVFRSTTVELARAVSEISAVPRAAAFASEFDEELRGSPATTDDESMFNVVAKPLLRTWATGRSRVDLKFVFSVLLTILLFWGTCYDTSRGGDELKRELHTQVSELHKVITEEMNKLAGLLGNARTVIRRRKMWRRPSTKAPVVHYLIPGVRVIVVDQRKKWARVVVMEDGGATVEGWTLKKYLVE